MLYKHTSWL
jgi:hypothetical protein